MTAGLALAGTAAIVRPLRYLLRKVVPKPGQGAAVMVLPSFRGNSSMTVARTALNRQCQRAMLHTFRLVDVQQWWCCSCQMAQLLWRAATCHAPRFDGLKLWHVLHWLMIYCSAGTYAKLSSLHFLDHDAACRCPALNFLIKPQKISFYTVVCAPLQAPPKRCRRRATGALQFQPAVKNPQAGSQPWSKHT